MRFLHAADWHLGRYFHGASLLADQAHVLDQLVDLARREKVDAVLIAGDVYDRAIPPADAVALLDDVLSRLVVGAGIPVVLIAGNHDSPDRLAFAGRIAEKQGLTLRGTLQNLSPVTFVDAHGTVAVHPLPFVEPVFARDQPGSDGATDHQGALNHMTALLRAQMVPGQRQVLVGHAFVAGGSESESERPLSVGGSGMVSASTFDGFDFVALGHLHRPQSVGSQRVQYAGSLLKYSFNEASHNKSVSIIELGADGVPAVQRIALNPLRDVRIVQGTLPELLAHPDPALNRQDYLCARLTDLGPVLDPMGRLREVYPNMMELQFPGIGTPDAPQGRVGGDHRKRQPEDLFRGFYRDMLGTEIEGPELDVFNEAVRSAMAAEQGAAR